MEGFIRLARAAGWAGYFGAPRLATAEHGEAIWRAAEAARARRQHDWLSGPTPDCDRAAVRRSRLAQAEEVARRVNRVAGVPDEPPHGSREATPR